MLDDAPYLVRDLAWHVVTYLVLLVSWIPVMNFFNENVWYTATVVFVIFALTAQVTTKIFLKKPFLWEGD